jgi:hypothetical protein
MSDAPEWFAPKRYGYGSGMPISWQGWVITVAFIVFAMGLSVALANQPLALIAALVAPTAAFMVICARTTRGGWRWRWGDRD